MPDQADFHLGAEVIAADGRKVGTLVRLIVQAKGFEVRALVVKEEESFTGRLLAAGSLLVTDEVVIPVAAVQSATREAVRLSLQSREVRHQTPYLSYQIKPLDRTTALIDDSTILLGGGVAQPSFRASASKSNDEIEIDRGENVMLGETGRRFGRVQDVLYDGGEMIGVVVRPDGFFKQDVMLPVRFISRADDLSLFARLTDSDIEHLQRAG